MSSTGNGELFRGEKEKEKEKSLTNNVCTVDRLEAPEGSDLGD